MTSLGGEIGVSLYASPSGWYKVDYPEIWVHDEKSNTVAFFEPVRGVGAVQISSYSLEEPERASPRTVLLEYLSQHDIKVDDKNIILESIDDKIVAHCEYTSNGRFWAIWVIHRSKKMLFVTYNCNEEDRDIERKDVEQLVNSIDFIDRDYSD